MIENEINSAEKSSNPTIFSNNEFPWPIFPRRKLARLGPSLFVGIQTVMLNWQVIIPRIFKRKKKNWIHKCCRLPIKKSCLKISKGGIDLTHLTHSPNYIFKWEDVNASREWQEILGFLKWNLVYGSEEECTYWAGMS